MLSFCVKFVQEHRQMDGRTMVEQYAPDLSMWGHKKTPKKTHVFKGRNIHVKLS